MKKLIFMTLLMLLVFGSTVFGAYTYTVKGKVYDNFAASTVSGATVKHTIKWSTTTSQSRTTTSLSDGSYTFTYTGLVNDPNGKAMNLTATTTTNQKGAKNWAAAGYSENKWCYVGSIILDPMLRIRTGVARWDLQGAQLTFDPAVIYREDIGLSQLQSYDVQLAFDPVKVQCIMVEPLQAYSSFLSVMDNETGAISVEAILAEPVTIGDVNEPTELFQMQWEVLNANSLYVTTVSTEPTSKFTINGQTGIDAVISQNDHLVGPLGECQATFLIDSKEEWQGALDAEWPNEHIRPLTLAEWEEYRSQWDAAGNVIEGVPYFEPYPDTVFIDPCLYVYPGGDEPNDAGLVMKWGDDTTADGNYASAWHWDYGLDPDLTNCTIQITVTAPQFGPSGQINQVSFSIVDIAGFRRSWWWQVGAAGSGSPIEWGIPKTVTINTAVLGVTAANPVATGYLNTASFNITQSQSFDVDENGQWIFNQVTVPPPGQPQFVGLWNYWHNLLVTKNTAVGSNKQIYVKWSQPPVEIDGENLDVADINGWDEWSNYDHGPVMADDWECNDKRPITDIHWWGSFQGWTLNLPPSVMPKAFHIGIWTDAPNTNPDDPTEFSHPLKLVWENVCTSYVWNFAGIDIDPQHRPEYEGETCFQFTQLLSEDEWFYQHPMEDGTPNVYWLSIAAIYDAGVYDNADFHQWGWKTRPHHYNDDAVRITDATLWPLNVGSQWTGGVPLQIPEYDPEQSEHGVTWDLAFELTTNEPAYVDDPIDGDVSGPVGVPDGEVNFFDIAEIAAHWLDVAP